ncbi:Ger(x)C family spore germination C-terminal domain-containing protein, partial [Pseudomonas sp. SIMBA_059]
LAVSTEDGGIYILESYKRDTKIDIKIENNVPSILINEKVEANITERTNMKSITNEKVEEIEKVASNVASKKNNKAVKNWQEN